MIWRILGIIGAFTFLRSGFSVLLDSNCVSIDFSGGGRVVNLTCYSDNSGVVSGSIAGFLAITLGVLLAWFTIRPWIQQMQQRSRVFNLSDFLLKRKSTQFENSHVEYEPIADSNLQTKDNKECPYCAETIKFKAIKCRYCGSSLRGKSQVNASFQVNKGPDIDINLIIALLAFSVFGFILFSAATDG